MLYTSSFLDATGHKAPDFWDDPAFNAPDQPVVGVAWLDAAGLCSMGWQTTSD